MELPDIPTEENIEKAANLLRRYYLVPDPKTGLLGTGSQFDFERVTEREHRLHRRDRDGPVLRLVLAAGAGGTGFRGSIGGSVSGVLAADQVSSTARIRYRLLKGEGASAMRSKVDEPAILA